MTLLHAGVIADVPGMQSFVNTVFRDILVVNTCSSIPRLGNIVPVVFTKKTVEGKLKWIPSVLNSGLDKGTFRPERFRKKTQIPLIIIKSEEKGIRPSERKK